MCPLCCGHTISHSVFLEGNSMIKISQLAKKFGLSRSTLLYYDSIGLLRPSLRSPSNYRLYSEADVEKMALIDVYRRAGLPLADVAQVMASDKNTLTTLLETRLANLNGEIQKLRQQQQLVLELLQGEMGRRVSRCLDRDDWVAILEATGLSDDDMQRWHVEFERLSPEAHQDFLESLGFDQEAITRIRQNCREEALEQTDCG